MFPEQNMSFEDVEQSQEYNLFGFDELDSELQSIEPEGYYESQPSLDNNPANSGAVVERINNHKLTKNELRFIRACDLVARDSANEAKSIAYYPPYLSKTTLPMVSTSEPVFERENGHLKLTMIGHPDWGLPYGKVARRLLVHLVTYSILHKTPVVPVVSMRQLSRDLNIPIRGKGHELIHNMLMRLFHATMFVMAKDDKTSEQIEVNRCAILDSVCITKDEGKQRCIVLDHKFYELCESSAAPIDLRVVNALQSPIEFDIYVFLLARLLTVKNIIRIPWADFIRQFGSSNKNQASAKQRLKKAIDKVMVIQPQMNVQYTDEFVILKPSMSAIKTRSGAYRLAGITS